MLTCPGTIDTSIASFQPGSSLILGVDVLTRAYFDVCACTVARGVSAGSGASIVEEGGEFG